MMRAIKNRPYPQLSMMKILSQSYILPLKLQRESYAALNPQKTNCSAYL